MPIPTVNFEGEYIPLNKVPTGAIRIKDVWYLNPAAIPEEFKAERMRLSAFREEIKKNGGNIPEDIKQALEKRAEETKKKSHKQPHTKDVQPVNGQPVKDQPQLIQPQSAQNKKTV